MSNHPTYIDALSIPTRGGQEKRQSEPMPRGDHERVSEVTVDDYGNRYERHQGAVSAYANQAVGTSGPFDSILSETGSPQSLARITEKSVVGIPGLGQMRLSTALDAGLVMRAADGSYYLPGQSPSGGQQQQTQQTQQTQQERREVHPDLEVEGTGDDTVERTFTGIVQNTAPDLQMTAVREIAETGELGTRTLNEMAYQMGATPDQLAATLEGMRGAFERQAMDAVAKSGVDPEAFFEWAYANKPKEMSAAIHRHLSMRNTQGYRQLARDYITQLDQIDPDAILNADLADGLTARMQEGKIILTDAQGRTFEWCSAIKAGIVRVGRRAQK